MNALNLSVSIYFIHFWFYSFNVSFFIIQLFYRQVHFISKGLGGV